MQNIGAYPKGTFLVFAIIAAAVPHGFPFAKAWSGFKDMFPGKLKMAEASPFGIVTGIKIVLCLCTTPDYLLYLQIRTAQ